MFGPGRPMPTTRTTRGTSISTTAIPTPTIATTTMRFGWCAAESGRRVLMDFFSVHKAWLNCRRRKRATPQAQCYEAYLLPEPREQLRSVLASYFGHFQHASHYRLVRRIFTRFPWLSCLFDLRGERLLPLWQPVDVSGYKSQQRFFRRTFPNAQIDIQCGCFFDRLPAPAVLQQQPGHRSSVSKVTVRQQGYLKGGLRRHAVEIIIFPPFSQTGVRLCEPIF